MKKVDIGIKTRDLQRIAVDVGAKCVHGVKVGDFACPDCLKIYGNKSVKKGVVECSSCGGTFGVSESGDNFWISNNGVIICDKCIFYPLAVLSKAFFSKDFKSAKKVIREFDEECDESFLGIEYV